MTLHQGNQTIVKRFKIDATLQAQSPWHVVGHWRVFDLIQHPHAALTKRDGNAGSFFIHHLFHHLNIRTRQRFHRHLQLDWHQSRRTGLAQSGRQIDL